MSDVTFLSRALVDGSVLAVVVGGIILASLRYNMRLWLHDYPKAAQERVPPLTAAEKRDRNVAAGLIFGTLVVFLLYGVVKIRSTGPVSFAAAYTHFFIMLMMFNLFDALVIDLMFLTWMKPTFAILPGMEGLESAIFSYKGQLIAFLKGIVFCTVFSIPFAILAVV